MNKVPIAHLTREELIAYRERLWRQEPSVSVLVTLGRIDRRLKKMEESNATQERAP